MALTKNQVSELYVAIFNMASDGEGNEFWQNYEGSAADIANTMLTVSTAKDYFGDALQDNQKFIEQIYLNTLGRTYEDDPEGIDYWTGRLNEGESFGSVVVTIIEVLNGEGLEGEALENQLNFQNRVEISNYVADTVEQPLANHAEVFGFADGLAGVTADPASVEAGKKAVDNVLNPVDPVVAALDNLAGAGKALEDFLKDAGKTLDVAEGDSVELAIQENVAAKLNTLSDSVRAIDVDDDTAGVINAKIVDQVNVNAEKLEEAQEELSEKTAELVKISGMPAALQQLQASFNAALAAEKAAVAAETKADAEEAKLETLYPTATGPFVEKDAKGVWKLAEGVTEQKFPGVGELLKLKQAQQAADKTEVATKAALEAAFAHARYIDASAGSKVDILAAGNFAPTTTDAAKLTQSEVVAELNKFLGEAKKANAALELDPDTQLIKDPTGPAEDAYNELRNAVNTFEEVDVDELVADKDFAGFLGAGPEDLVAGFGLTTQQFLAAQGKVSAAQNAINTLTKEVADLQEANALLDELNGLKKDIETAEEAFEGLDVVPQSIDGVAVGTAENDVFVAAGKDGSILSFGLQGEDRIYVGDAIEALVKLSAGVNIATDSVGSSSALEIFVQQNALDVDLWVEKEVFGGNASSNNDLFKITLSGVSVDDLVLEDGFLAIA